MESQIWVKAEEKWAFVLLLRDLEVSQLKVTGNMLTLKRNLGKVVEGLEKGQGPSTVGAKSVETLDVRSISKAQVSPGNGSLTIHGGEGGSKSLDFSTADNNADAILQAILAGTGRTFQPSEGEIGVVEALIPPVILGAIGGLFWYGLYDAAGKMVAGEDVEVKGIRRRSLKRFLITIAETLGTNGTFALGALRLVLVLGWATMRIVRLPKRTVWLPENT